MEDWTGRGDFFTYKFINYFLRKVSKDTTYNTTVGIYKVTEFKY